MRCWHRQDDRLVLDWLPGRVVAGDLRMLAVRFEAEVFANTGQAIPDRTLWCTHGSRNIRRPGEREQAGIAREVNSDD
jgi:hypothetical protein